MFCVHLTVYENCKDNTSVQYSHVSTMTKCLYVHYITGCGLQTLWISISKSDICLSMFSVYHNITGPAMYVRMLDCARARLLSAWLELTLNTLGSKFISKERLPRWYLKPGEEHSSHCSSQNLNWNNGWTVMCHLVSNHCHSLANCSITKHFDSYL